MIAPPLACLNGRLVPPAELALSFADAGFVQGATVTDYCRTYRRALFRWPQHLARLRRDAGEVGIPFPWTDLELTAAAGEVLASHPPGGELSLVTFATPGPLARLSPSGASGPPTLGMHAQPIRRPRLQDGARLVCVGEHPTGGFPNPPPGVKHRSRLHWYRAEQAARLATPDAVALLTAPDGSAADTPIGAVLAVRDGAVIASPAGTVQESVSVGVVAELCASLGVPFREEAFRPGPGHDPAEELLLAGSAFGVAGARDFRRGDETRHYGGPGPLLLRLRRAWGDLVGVDIAAELRPD